MLGRTLCGRGVVSAVLQTHAAHHPASQCSMLFAWMTRRNTEAFTSHHAGSSAHLHTTTAHLTKNRGVYSNLSDPQTCFPRTQNQSYGAWTHPHHTQTTATPPLPYIATRGLATLSSRHLNKNNVHNRTLAGAVMVGGVVVSVRGMAKDTGSFKNLQGRISSLQVKKRVQRKKKKIQEESEEAGEEVAGFAPLARHKFLTFDPDFTLPEMQVHRPPLREWQVTAYATADEYNLERLLDGLTHQGLYTAASFTSAPASAPHPHSLSSQDTKPSIDELPDPSEVLHVKAAYHLESEPREIYFFQSGAVVFWNVAELERNSVLRFLRPYQKGGHDERTVDEESESLTYTYSDTPARTKLIRDTIQLNPEGPTDLEKYTFSNALALSVQLGIWEAALDHYIDNIEYVSEELSKTGRVVLSQDQVLQRMGQLFGLRHEVNLSSDLLDVPDFYWEHENLEQLYRKTSEHLSVSKRTSVMNVKLSHCVELMELLKSHLNERHSARLEWIIIILIMVEVGFELLHFLERLL
ncbi:Required for meiotic nuclear division protein 1 [Chionoecetes opilio]|uniref:Required for meiotic nuclear division protein 1 n=1 Tax=Chionoecetes opilio TaxID=41210 RepID=A0A8J5CZS7_CHIOP|nr:Required for meiotic nuclear division protein 1 [Chionoecetes opilio]